MKKLINILFAVWYLLVANTTLAYTHADTLRGSNGSGRSWWDVQHYDLSVKFDLQHRSITGSNTITYKLIGIATDSMQIDLQQPLVIDEVVFLGEKLPFSNDGNVWWIKYPSGKLRNNNMERITIKYHGTPRSAINPPWDGGFSWKKDSTGKPWVAVSCQGLGASVWWPCKDAQWDEPDNGMDMHFTIPDSLSCISNGRLLKEAMHEQDRIWNWHVENPINTYDVTFYIGDYVHWKDTLIGEKGKLDLDFYVLRYNEERARKQFEVVRPMIHCFEYWMGPYPFYEDGYKLVEAPYLGMEHQSAVAYGNKYKMGYKGSDRSGTDIGLSFDYIIVHESGHEWFGNSITAKDMADNWVHEGITDFSESLFAECLLGKEKAQIYSRGEWHNILNNKPIIGDYGVNKEGSGDMYDKGSAIMYMIRSITGDDEKFRQMLRGVSQEYYHKTVTTEEIENYIAKHTGLDLKAFFDQYLRTKDIPLLAYYIKDNSLYYRFENCVPGFSIPVTLESKRSDITIQPTIEWQHRSWKGGYNIRLRDQPLIEIK